MFKVSHELPINMLDKSFEINDYEYCLPHLLDQNETYRKHFEDAKESGSYIIMDNSLHELGFAYKTDRLLHWIEHLEPNEFIVPDVWQDKTATLVNAKRWLDIDDIEIMGLKDLQIENYEINDNITSFAEPSTHLVSKTAANPAPSTAQSGRSRRTGGKYYVATSSRRKKSNSTGRKVWRCCFEQVHQHSDEGRKKVHRRKHRLRCIGHGPKPGKQRASQNIP